MSQKFFFGINFKIANLSLKTTTFESAKLAIFPRPLKHFRDRRKRGCEKARAPHRRCAFLVRDILSIKIADILPGASRETATRPPAGQKDGLKRRKESANRSSHLNQNIFWTSIFLKFPRAKNPCQAEDIIFINGRTFTSTDFRIKFLKILHGSWY